MSYRISYEPRRGSVRRWVLTGICIAALSRCAVGLMPVWSRMAAGERLYDSLAWYVGEMILNGH